MKLRHTAAWVGFTAVTLLAASACGTEGARTAAKAVSNGDKIMAALARATDRTENLGSAEVKMSADMGTGTGPVVMEGTFSWGDGFAFDVDMDTKHVQMQALTASPKVRVLLVDGAYYYDIDPQPSGPLKGKEWMKIDSSAVFGEKGAQAMAGNSGGGSPVASMKALKYANDVEDLGKQNVDGQSATHYRAVIKADQMGKLKDVYGDQDNLFDSVTGANGRMTMDIWVNGKDLPVRMKQVMGSLTVTTDFEKFDKTATVKAPPAAQTGDLTEAMKNAQQQQG
ncbi:hypothetical protein ABT124_26975 [Streptomyces sp. NPDC001982]|uniref:hypothetical protein n=1 Tax=Streptomyces sp. NPDC001982 TaxID=3154405 RepID=UPI00332EF050